MTGGWERAHHVADDPVPAGSLVGSRGESQDMPRRGFPIAWTHSAPEAGLCHPHSLWGLFGPVVQQS